jgi:hypothetical protein
MIDTTTGDITLASTTVGRGFTLRAFRASVLAPAAAPALVGGGPWLSFDVGEQRIERRAFRMTLRFEGDRLATVALSLVASEAPGDAWSERAALLVKRRHDAWLSRRIGSPPYAYAWGRIESTYDPRSASSSIVVSYAA